MLLLFFSLENLGHPGLEPDKEKVRPKARSSQQDFLIAHWLSSTEGKIVRIYNPRHQKKNSQYL